MHEKYEDWTNVLLRSTEEMAIEYAEEEGIYNAGIKLAAEEMFAEWKEKEKENEIQLELAESIKELSKSIRKLHFYLAKIQLEKKIRTKKKKKKKTNRLALLIVISGTILLFMPEIVSLFR